MSPILVRPVREQLEHDKVIRLLQAKYKRKFEVGINPGPLQAVPVGSGPTAIFPDLVLQSPERSHKVLGVIEVETSESVNHLEAMSQWAGLGRLRLPFYLYVPAGCIDTTRRLCSDHQIPVSEVWTYHPVGDQIRFTMIMRSAQAPQPKAPTAKIPSSKVPSPKVPSPKVATSNAVATKAPAARPPASPAPRKPAPLAAKRRVSPAKAQVRAPAKPASRGPSAGKPRNSGAKKPSGGQARGHRK